MSFSLRTDCISNDSVGPYGKIIFRGNFYSCPFDVVVSVGKKETQGDSRCEVRASVPELYKMELGVFSPGLVYPALLDMNMKTGKQQ